MARLCQRVTMEQDTGVGGGDQCVPEHLPNSQQPCAFLTDRQLCKRGALKVALSPETPEIRTDTPSHGEDRWPSRLLIKKAASCNIKKWSSA